MSSPNTGNSFELWDALQPRSTDRIALVGQTGSGKTTLAKVILEQRDYCVVHDGKGRINWGEAWHVHTSLKRITQDDWPWLVYRPSYDELANPTATDAFFRWVYERHNTTLYVDEIYSIARGDVYPYHYGACLTRGRELHIETFTATQRPARVPQIMFSEAEHVYCFRLKMPQDRERVALMTGLDGDLLRDLPKHYFYYAPQDGDVSGPYTLNPARANNGTGKASAVP